MMACLTSGVEEILRPSAGLRQSQRSASDVARVKLVGIVVGSVVSAVFVLLSD